MCIVSYDNCGYNSIYMVYFHPIAIMLGSHDEVMSSQQCFLIMCMHTVEAGY